MTLHKRSVSILVLDDDISILKGFTHFLSTIMHHQVSAYTHPAKALQAIKKDVPDILLCDLHLPDMDGISFIKTIKELPGKHPEIIIITGHGEKANAIECLKLGAVDFLEKPFGLEILRDSVDRVVQFIASKEKKEQVPPARAHSGPHHDTLPPAFIGKSPAIENIRNLIAKIAVTNDTSVLITGETGTGKEVIARLIHFSSHRRSHPFYVKNCATVPEYLFESEFFGHVKGAFTNAVTDHKGWFEVANQSTLLLDEISTLPMAMQPKLLRVLEEKNLNRVGSSATIPLNVRVVAASNTDLEEMCQQQKFRLDLFYRLNIFSIHVPPLRERQEDIPLLFEHFIALSARHHEKKPIPIRAALNDLLRNHQFPGNVRELKNIAEKMTIMFDGSQDPADLLASILLVREPGPKTSLKRAKSITESEIELITNALKQSGNVVTKAARILQISDQSLLRRIKKYDIHLPV